MFELAQTYGKLSRCFDVSYDGCEYYPACYEIEIVIYSETEEYAYKVIGLDGVCIYFCYTKWCFMKSLTIVDFTDGPVWCTEGKHVFLGDSYILCPSINDLLLRWDANEITVVDDYVPPPCEFILYFSLLYYINLLIVCDENCETCAVAHDENQCLTCDEGSVLLGPPPNACNGTDYMELGIYSTME